MKILYIGCYRDGTGWAHAAENYILSLDAAGIEVVPRFVKLNEMTPEIHPRIEELESNDDKNCDIVIQHVLPHHMDYNGNFEKNIALYVTETSHCKNTTWPERIGLMDEAWVPNSFMAKEMASTSLISTPHHIVPHAFDINKYQEEYTPLEMPILKDKFVFYYIGEISRRKNLGGILTAFHLEFKPEEDVGILLKAYLPGKSPEESENHLSEFCDKIKEGLKLYPNKSLYHSEIFITQYLKQQQIMQIHTTCDCFVSSSFGEAWGIPIFDAMAMGKTPICTNSGGPKDFINGGGYLIDSRKEPCFGTTDTFSEVYVGNEDWDSPSINEIRKSMRLAFENKKDKEKRSSRGVENSYKYSHVNVGNKMLAILNGECEPLIPNSQAKEKNAIKEAPPK